VEEGFGEAADGFESAALPETEGALVGGDDEVELHGAEATLFGVVEGVEAHGAGDSAALLGGSGGVAAGACSEVSDGFLEERPSRPSHRDLLMRWRKPNASFEFDEGWVRA